MPDAVDVRLLDRAAWSDPADQARRLAPVLKALADENRLAVLLTLASRPQHVRELAETVGLGQTLVSHHLKILREHGLVTVTARGRSNVYAVCCDALDSPVRLLASLAACSPQDTTACDDQPD